MRSQGSTARIDGAFVLDKPVVVPHSVSVLELGPSAQLKARGNTSALVREGRISFREALAYPVNTERLWFPVSDPKLYIEGEYIMISGRDVIPGSVDKYGYMRQIVQISGSRIRIDSGIPRSITSGPRIAAIDLAPSLHIRGRGQIFNLDPENGQSELIRFFATSEPRVSGVTVSNNGTTGISVIHCLGGRIACTITDLLDDGVTHFGYGVNVAGVTRGLVVKGVMKRVRHAVTTNPGPNLPDVGTAGEPEDCWFEPIAIDCSNKSIDTHRAGWNTTIVPRVSGGAGGVQVRADNTKVIGGSIRGSSGPGVAVSAVVIVPAKVVGVTISELKPPGTALLALGPMIARNVKIRDCFGHNIVLNSDSIVYGGSIRGGSPVGIEFTGSNNFVMDVDFGASVTTTSLQADGLNGNVVIERYAT
ncbi:hypothetical protein N1027_01300 [Herbiconiux sp. CPCC 205763]|uniref:Uncharacterized protein n=1 Tax=Herbiconiux aconitum TaxID=2970913 RepID=A0ABT2GKV3_9MICO|nr:hypothetical protein [Herbiconiux aconitum]MCS5716766.1 hypothetical protein [Herbiconiux aconitum]